MRLKNAEWEQTTHIYGAIDPTLILVHGTGTRIEKGEAVRYCRKNDRKVAYHVIIERDGTVVQMAPLNKRCNHAGRSSWKGRQWCNSFSIGIGLVDPGELRGTQQKAMTFYREWFYTEDELVAMDTPHHGKGWIWLPYTDQQITALNEVVTEIRAAYPGIDIAGHYQVSPGRKIDPTPLLDIAAIGGVAPAVDDGLAVAKVEPTAKILAKESREYRGTNVVKGGLVTGATGLTILEAASSANLQSTKSYLDIVNTFIASYGVPMVVGACVLGWGVCELIQHWKRESYEVGAYEPSGASEDAT